MKPSSRPCKSLLYPKRSIQEENAADIEQSFQRWTDDGWKSKFNFSSK